MLELAAQPRERLGRPGQRVLVAGDAAGAVDLGGDARQLVDARERGQVVERRVEVVPAAEEGQRLGPDRARPRPQERQARRALERQLRLAGAEQRMGEHEVEVRVRSRQPPLEPVGRLGLAPQRVDRRHHAAASGPGATGGRGARRCRCRAERR